MKKMLPLVLAAVFLSLCVGCQSIPQIDPAAAASNAVAIYTNFLAALEPGEAGPDTPAQTNAWPKACAELKCAMATPLFVMRDTEMAAKQAAQIKGSGKFNSIASLVDLQSGRDYIVAGRTATALAAQSRRIIENTLSLGLTPVVLIRNDWKVRTKGIPSLGGAEAPSNDADFYTAAMLEQEKAFCASFRDLWPYVHLQLSIEPNHKDSAAFALSLAQYLRAEGFANKLIVNPLGDAVAAHESIRADVRADLSAANVTWARSWHSASAPPDGTWNTDGNNSITDANFGEWVSRLENSGKEYILWSKTLANSSGAFPTSMFPAVPEVVQPATNAPDPAAKGALWKPVSESNGKLVVLLPDAFTGKTPKTLKLVAAGKTLEEAKLASVANGNREHYRFKSPGSKYPSNCQFVVEASGYKYSWTVKTPSARSSDMKATRDPL